MERQNSDPDEADKDKDAHREATTGNPGIQSYLPGIYSLVL